MMATPEATEKYFKRLAHQNIPEHAIRIFGSTGLQVSSIGFGGYRVHYNSIEHARALRYALLNGFNLIDTSSNYTDGGSEMLIGNMLQEMFDRNELSRDEVVVVSKVGYVQGQNMKLVQQNEVNGQPFPEVVKYMDGCWHCIHPDFLQDQLSRTLERLRLPSLDIYLLHNPEYFLSNKKKRNGLDPPAAREEYYRRIKKAFEWMEEKVTEGKFKAYGISSNTFPSPGSDFEFTSLEKVIEIAGEVSTKNYFQVIQFPFNLFETGAGLERNQHEGSKTVLQLAAEKNLATLANRPLNAMYNGRMIRLASFRESDPKEIVESFHTKLTSLQRLERQFKDQFIAKISEPPQEHLEKVFSISRQLDNALTFFHDWEHWDHVKQNVIMPQSFSYLNFLDEKLQDAPGWKKWTDSYAQTLVNFLDIITRNYENEAQVRSIKLSGKLKSINKDLETSETLSQKALRILTSVNGVHCVLLGMRKIPYVEDALVALKAPSITDAEDLLVKLN